MLAQQTSQNREALGLSLSQAQATSAPNIGTVALRMLDRPVVIDSSANAKHANGMPELRIPTKKVRRQFSFNYGMSPRIHTSGNRNSEAMTTRTAAVGRGPNSSTPIRMKKNDAPQIAASNIKSASQGFGLACFAEVGEFKAWFPVVRLPV